MNEKQNNTKNTCKNCATEFEGSYCPECGQTIKHFDKPFKFFIVDFFGNVFAFDTRLWTTFKAVLFRPGKMTKDFMDGKRVKYMPPFRFYIFMSFVFFLLLNFQTRRQILDAGINISADTTETGEVNYNILGLGDERDSNENIMKLDEVLKENDSINEEFTQAIEEIVDGATAVEDSLEHIQTQTANNERDIDIKHIIEHPEIYVERFFKYSSWSLFLLMPVFALMLLLFFKKTYKHYIAHLIFSLNQHAFLFFLLTIIIAVKMTFPEKDLFLENKLILLSPVYLLIGARKLYNRNWVRTFFSLLTSVLIYVLIIIPIIILAMMLALNVL